MKTASLSQQRLLELIARFSDYRVAVVGDFFLDKYLEVDPRWEEPSLETGKPAHQVAGVRMSPGAAGTVVANLAALGAGELHAVGFVGDDGEGFELRRGLEKIGCATKHLAIAAGRMTPTYLKPRDNTRPGLEGEHSRYDTKNRTPTPPATERCIARSLETLLPLVDAVIVVDQVEEDDCGAVTAFIREAICSVAPLHPKIFFWADSRRHIRDFRNLVIKPNQFEAMGLESPATDEEIALEDLLEPARQLRQNAAAPVFVTRGPKDLLLFDEEPTIIPALRVAGPIDTTGAGDSLTAGCVLARCAGATFAEAGLVGNLVASVTIQHLAATGTAQPDELPARLQAWQAQNGMAAKNTD